SHHHCVSCVLRPRSKIRTRTLIATTPGTHRVIRALNRSCLPQTTSHYSTSDKCDRDPAARFSFYYSRRPPRPIRLSPSDPRATNRQSFATDQPLEPLFHKHFAVCP